MRLRYTGSVPVTFMTHGVGEVGPGDEFEVPDEGVDGFLRHPTVEPAAEPPQQRPPRGRKAAVGGEQTDEDSTLTTEEVCGVPDDH